MVTWNVNTAAVNCFPLEEEYAVEMVTKRGKGIFRLEKSQFSGDGDHFTVCVCFS